MICIINEPSCVEDDSSEELVMNTTSVCSPVRREGTYLEVKCPPLSSQKMTYLQYERHQFTWCLIYSHQRNYPVTKCRQRTIHAASLLCIHLSWPHFPSTFQATQYFIRVVRKMCNIYYLALRANDPYKNSNPGKNFITALFCDK